MTPSRLAAYWDWLIAEHVAAGDDPATVAAEFGLHPITVVTVGAGVSDMRRVQMRLRELNVVRAVRRRAAA